MSKLSLRAVVLGICILLVWPFGTSNLALAQQCQEQGSGFEELGAPTQMSCTPSTVTIPGLVSMTLNGGTLLNTDGIIGQNAFGQYIPADPVQYVNSTWDRRHTLGLRVGCYDCPSSGCVSPFPANYGRSITIQFSQKVINVKFGLSNFLSPPYAYEYTTFSITADDGSSTTARLREGVIETQANRIIGGPVSSITISVPDIPENFSRWAFGICAVYYTPYVAPVKGSPSITANPKIGATGDIVTVTSTNWPSPTSPSEYVFKFNGIEVGQRQTVLPCQSIQPYTQFAVPANTPPGQYPIAVTLIPKAALQSKLRPQAAPSGSLSATTSFTVENIVVIGPLSVVPKDKTINVNVTLAPGRSQVSLTLSTKSGTTGSSVFEPNKSTTLTLDPDNNATKVVSVPITGITESNIADNIQLVASTRSPLTTKNFSVLKVDSIEVSIPSTKNPITGARPTQAAFTTTNNLTEFATATTSDFMVVFQGTSIGLPTVKANGVVPTTLAQQLRWQINRDPSDTVATGTPSLNKSVGDQVVITPGTAGNFIVICYVDNNNNGSFDQGEELRVLRMAIVRMTLKETDTSIDKFMPSFVGVDLGPESSIRTDGIMLLFTKVLLEGGGANRLIGVDKVKIGNVGNLKMDTFQVNYPGDVVGKAIESPDGSLNPSGSLPMFDAGVPKGQEPTGGDVVFRRTSRDARGNSPSGLGKIAEITSSDDPGFGPWKDLHQTTGNPWATTQDGFGFTEFILAYSADFPRYYVALAKADWTVKGIGQSNNGLWTDTGSIVMLQGSANESAPFMVTIMNGSPQPGDEAGVQVLGLSYVNNYKYLYIP